MTREEAIKILKSKMDGSVDTSYEWTEAIRMAIEALHKTEWIPVSEALPSKGQVVLDIDDKETWGDKGTWDVDKQRGERA